VVPQTIIRWANDGTLACTRTAGGHRRFRKSDVAALRARLYGPDRDPDAGAVSQALAAPAPSALSQLHPDLVTELARFLALEAGWSPEDLDGFGGDPDFTAEVQAAMADLLAGGER
jgi:excisionase family DNA binding protein